MKAPAGLARWRLGLFAAAGLLAIVAVIIVNRTVVLNASTIRADMAARLAAWTGGNADISGPLELHYFPSLSLTTGAFELNTGADVPFIRRVSAKSATIELGYWSLLTQQSGLRRLVLIEPDVTLRAPDAAADPADDQRQAAVLSDLLREMPIESIDILDGTIAADGQGDGEPATQIDLETTIDSSNRSMTAGGTLTWRKQPLEFRFSGGLPNPSDATSKPAMTLSMRGPMVSADIDGASALANGLRVSGSLDLQVEDLRKFARWLGVLVPEGPGLRRFSAAGAFHWHHSRITFDDGTFTLDGNRSLGTLSLDIAGTRPAIEGTLAFTALDVSHYGVGSGPAPAGGSTPKTAARPLAFDFPLLHHADLDLRLSTNEIVAPSLTLGQTALSVAVKSGRLAADFAFLDVCGGNGNGRLIFDASLPESKTRLTGRFAELAFKECADALVGGSPLSATLDLGIDLESQGRLGAELIEHLSGTVTLAASGGEFNVDLAGLVAGALASPVHGWDAFAGGDTGIDEAAGKLVLRQGTVTTDDLYLVSDKMRYMAEGTIDLQKRMLDFEVSMRDESVQPPKSVTPADAVSAKTVFIKGPWQRPISSAERTPATETGTTQMPEREQAAGQ